MSLVTFLKRRGISSVVSAVMMNDTLSPLQLCGTGGKRAGWPSCGGLNFGS